MTLPDLLAPFLARDIIETPDGVLATRLAELSGEDNPVVVLSCAFVLRALRSGSVALDLERAREQLDRLVESATDDLPWPPPLSMTAALADSPMVAQGSDSDAAALRHVDGLLYLERYWQWQQTIARSIAARHSAPALPVDAAQLSIALSQHFPALDGEPDRQRLAAATAAVSRFTVVAGGPGTGKTTTIARLLAVMHAVSPSPPLVALAAPTGKAAARLTESIHAQAAELGEAARFLGGLHGSTVHRLLGPVPGSSTRFRRDSTHRLPHDVVIIDEASMLSVMLTARLVDALKPEARLVLVGDPDQLTSVDAGAVLADIRSAPLELGSDAAAVIAATDTHAPPLRCVVELTRNHRFTAGIATVAAAVRDGRVADSVADMRRSSAVSWRETPDATPLVDEQVRQRMVMQATCIAEAAERGETENALAALETHRVLCAHRSGPFGAARWNNLGESWLRSAGLAQGDRWYPGRPVLVTQNSPELGLFNGDTGVTVTTDSGLRVAFRVGSQTRLVSPSDLGEAPTLFAMTVHKSQGSQFSHVTLVLPGASSPVLTRGLLYTALTRAREHVSIVGSEAAVRRAVATPVLRASGLSAQWGLRPHR